MPKTVNFGLVKPDPSDFYDVVTQANENADILEEALTGKLTLERVNKDAEGIFTEIRHKRPDGTLFRKSVLSGGTTPKYTTRTVTFYQADGTTVASTIVYTITYTGDDLTSEVVN